MLLLGLLSQLLAIPLLFTHVTPALLTRMGSITLVYAAVLSYNGFYPEMIGDGLGIYSGYFTVTSITQAIETLLYLVGAMILVAWAPMSSREYGQHEKVESRFMAIPTHLEYPMLALFSAIGASFLISSADLVSMYLSIELQSFSLYILASLYRNSVRATSAGLKYFMLGALSSALILLGSSLVYAYTGLTNISNMSSMALIDGAQGYTQALMFGMLIICIGFLFKISAAPFHHWAPSVYDGTPTIVTTWLTTMPKISITIFLLQFVQGPLAYVDIINDHTLEYIRGLLLFSSLLSLAIGTVVGLSQTRIKRLLAYSTISHVGFILLALAINSSESIDALLFYLLQYSFTNLNTFLIVLAFGYSITWQSRGHVEKWVTLSGFFTYNRALAFSLALCLFSMAGIPPLIGFFAKYMVLYSAMMYGYSYSALIAILASVVSAVYYIRIIKILYFSSPLTSWENQSLIPWPTNPRIFLLVKNRGRKENEEEDAARMAHITPLHAYLISLLSLAIALFILNPSLLLNCSHLLALWLFT